jgi:DNA-binding beta-propeller fold protein YncE
MPIDIDRLLAEPVHTTPPDVDNLWRRGRRRRIRSYVVRSALVLAVIVVAAVGGGISPLRSGTRNPHPVSPSNTAPVTPVVPATTAFVVDASGLVPIDLATNQVGTAIAIANFPNSSANYFGAPPPVVSPDGTTAYVVSLPTPAVPGVNETGPALVPVNLVTHTVERPIAFRATAIRGGAIASMFAIASLAMAPDGTTVFVADAADNALIPINVQTDQVGHPISLPSEPAVNSFIVGAGQADEPSPITSVAVTPDGKTAYVTDGYAVVPVDLVHHQAERPITGFDDASSIAIAPDGRMAYVTNPYCWESIKTALCVKRPSRPVVEPNGKIQFYAGGNHVTVIDLRSNTIEREIDVGKGAQPTGVAVAPDGSQIYVTYGQYGELGGDVTVINARTDKTVVQINEGFAPRSNQGADDIAITPGGAEAFVSAFQVVTPGPYGPTVFRGVVPINLASDTAEPAIDFGAPANYGVSTGAVVFGK